MKRAGSLALVFVAAASLVAPASAQQPQPDSPWRQRFERARAALVEQRFSAAEEEFKALEQSAANDQERHLAHELEELARLGEDKRSQAEQPAQRTGDELGALYTTAALYGIGTAAMVTLQFEPKTFGGALLPFVVFIPAAVGGIALIDSYRPFPHGVPQALASGVYLGLTEALWLVGYQRAHADLDPGSKPWRSERVSLVLWAGSTAGGIVGGLVGAVRRPTPGRVSFTASTGLWSGVLSAFAASALEPQSHHRSQTAYLAGAIAYNVGLLAGITLGPSVAPSVARVRFVDLGGLAGALLGAGGYALIAQQGNSRGSLAAAAIGGALGLGISWWGTTGMPADHSHDRLGSALGSLHPTLAPTHGGFVAGLVGRL
jgi:hypothetical protein